MKTSMQRMLMIITMAIQFGCTSTPKIDSPVKEIGDVRHTLINYQRTVNDSIAELKADRKYHYEKICENSLHIHSIEGKIVGLSSKIDICLEKCEYILSKLQEIDTQQFVSVTERQILKGNDMRLKNTIESMLLLENEQLRQAAKENARRALQHQGEQDHAPQPQQ
jgi:hypothetical protein